jgi:DNA-binding transcriptional LysR family regulator
MKEFSPDYRYLRAFIITCKHLNFSKAAHELNIAQSAVSRQIKLLEDSLGHQLIIRSSKKVILTDQGEFLLRESKQFEEKLHHFFFGDSKKTIHIGILHGLLENWFHDLLVEFRQKSDLQLNIEVNSLDQLKEKLHNGKYDLVFTTENFQSEIVSSLKLFEERMVLISKEKINPLEANLYPWIVYSEQDHLFQIYKKKSHQIIVVNSMTSILRLVKSGVGIAIVPDHTLGENDLHIYELKGLKKQHIHLSSLNLKRPPNYLKEILDLIKKN